MTNHVKRRLKHLLLKEQKIIQAGNLAGLEPLISQKEALIQELEGGDIEASDLKDLRQEAERNELHLQAARRGIKSVQTRVKELIEGGRSFKTYSANGTSTTITNPISQRNKTV